MNDTVESANADHRARTRAINRTILDEEKRVRAANGWLAHQDALGLGIFLASVVVTLGTGAACLSGLVAWWLAVPVMAFALSLLHELEHDLIHGLYFRHRGWVVDLMFTGIWVLKQNLNPWTRRELHLLHHRRSGQVDDIEERLIGLGLPFGFRRILSWFPFGSSLLLAGILFDLLVKRHGDTTLARPIPRGWAWLRLGIDGVFLTAPLVVTALAFRGNSWAKDALIVAVAPQMLRHTSIAIVSSYSHYWQVRENDVYEQNQVLDHWSLVPLQLFCFNFGSTHIIHHYVVQQPFYLRQLVAKAAHVELRRQGVPFNDLGTFARANRRPPEPAPDLPRATPELAG